MKLNSCITKLKLEMNPAASALIQDIEAICDQNSHTILGDCIPHYVSDIQKVSQLTAESLLDCSFDQKVKDAMMNYLPPEGCKLLEKLTKGDQPKIELTYNSNANERLIIQDLQYRLDKLGVEGRARLVQDISAMHSFDVCEVVNKIYEVTRDNQKEK